MRRTQMLSGLLIILATAVAVSQPLDDAELAAGLQVHGVMVSSNSQVAIINNRLTRVGDQIGAARVLAIEPSTVHLRVAERSFAIRVGSSIIRESDYAEPRVPEIRDLSAQSVPEFPEQYAPAMVSAEDTYGPVAPGQTLSQIAASMAPEPGRQQWLMAAMYEANPQAFGSSMDVLYAGAHLALPAAPAERRLAQRTETASGATAAPVSERAPTAAPIRAADVAAIAVQPGDTLSQIAVGLRTDGITLNQLMLSIFAANPHSFGGNVNVLYANTVLQIPDASAWHAQTPEAAHEEVARQASAWVSVQATNST